MGRRGHSMNCRSQWVERLTFSIFCVILLLLMTPSLAVDSDVTYTDQWAVHIEGGHQIADGIAQRNGFINLGKVILMAS